MTPKKALNVAMTMGRLVVKLPVQIFYMQTEFMMESFRELKSAPIVHNLTRNLKKEKEGYRVTRAAANDENLLEKLSLK